MNINKPVCDIVFISGERSNLSDLENHDRTMALMNRFEEEGLSYKVVRGSYEGVEEASFAVALQFAEDLLRLRQIGTEFNQDCIMRRDLNGDCFIVQCGVDSWNVDKIGRMERIMPHERHDLKAWTYDYQTKQYWTVK